MTEPNPTAPAQPTATPALEIEDLTIGLDRRGQTQTLVRGVNLTVEAGGRLGIVGESGSGKSLTMLAVMALLSPPLRIISGSIRLDGHELVGAGEDELRGLRGTNMAMIYQDPMTSLDPMQRVGVQVAEGPRAHGVSRTEAETQVISSLADVGFGDPEHVARQYPHQLSGGMRQRVMIAAALIGEPRLLIADEPTTALDVTIQRQILQLVARLQRSHGMAVAWVTHDLGVVAQFAQRVAVMYAGRVVEHSETHALFAGPQHPYSAALLASLPNTAQPGERLAQIAGAPPDMASPIVGCAFAPRCPYQFDRCESESPSMQERANGAAAACLLPPERWVKTP